MTDLNSNIVPFRRPGPKTTRNSRTLLDDVYAAGSLSIAADDIATKTAALMLQAFGFLCVDEIQSDGRARRLKRGEPRKTLAHPWRLSKPAFSGVEGVPDAVAEAI